MKTNRKWTFKMEKRFLQLMAISRFRKLSKLESRELDLLNPF